jgi:hypothetical protein
MDGCCGRDSQGVAGGEEANVGTTRANRVQGTLKVM